MTIVDRCTTLWNTYKMGSSTYLPDLWKRCFIEPCRTFKKKKNLEETFRICFNTYILLYISSIGKCMKSMNVCQLFRGNEGRMWNITKEVNGRIPGLSPSWTYNALSPAPFAVERGQQQTEEGNRSVSEVQQSQHAKPHFLFWLGL